MLLSTFSGVADLAVLAAELAAELAVEVAEDMRDRGFLTRLVTGWNADWNCEREL